MESFNMLKKVQEKGTFGDKYEAKSYKAKELEVSKEEGHVREIWNNTEYLTADLLEKYREQILSGKYSAVLGLDSSGRIPALLAGKVIQGVYDKKFQDKELELLFFSGKNRFNDDSSFEAEDEFKHLNHLSGQHVLLIDDFIETGTGLSGIAEVLKEKDIQFDLGALGGATRDFTTPIKMSDSFGFDSEKDLKTFNDNLERWKENSGANQIEVNYAGGDLPKIYGQHQAGGVYKNGGAFAHAIPNEELATLEIDNKEMPIKNIMRKIMKDRVPEMVDDFLDNE